MPFTGFGGYTGAQPMAGLRSATGVQAQRRPIRRGFGGLGPETYASGGTDYATEPQALRAEQQARIETPAQAAQQASQVAQSTGAAYSIDPRGETSYSYAGPDPQLERLKVTGGQATDMAKLQAQQASDYLKQRGEMNEAAEARMFSRVSPYLDNQAQVGYGAGGGGDEAARAAAFARAKDRIGQQSRAAVDSLRNLLGERGMLGGGYESAGLGAVIGGSAGALGDVEREQAIADATRSGQIADMTYQGNIAQRGQNLNRQQSLLSLLASGRGLY